MNTRPRGKLSDPFFSLIVFSIYSGLMGAILLFVPRIVLPPFGVHEEVNSFTFMLGFVLLCSSFYYFASGMGKDRLFAKLTVYTRFAVPFVTVTLYLTGNVPINYVLLGILDASGGVWTFLALRSSPVLNTG
ncbi:MAG: hypothetical protein GTO12_06160 [Proteobacteria bacterium]|nr:hypothetical protein [Pseudomonadota bacterium]